MEAVKLAEPFAEAQTDIGMHAIGDLCGINPDYLKDEKLLMRALADGLAAARFTVLSEQALKFPGVDSGVTGMFILSESHAAFHSYPEFGYLAIDVFSCGSQSPETVVRYVASRLGARDSTFRLMERGRNVRLD
ncbi:MAG: adenosylmethionine decarboxylase [Alphaproteobacteria bacterium]|nr:adenosylmethionine decarboxylase [Alphaproteobacteria bacterium]